MSETPSDDDRYCPSCGAAQSRYSRFCSECGIAIEDEGESAAGSADPQGTAEASQPQSHGGQWGTHEPAPQAQDEGWSAVKIVVVALGVVFLAIPALVVMAAVLASFVLGLGDTTEIAPNPSFESTYHSANATLAVQVESGDAFEADRVLFVGEGIEQDGAHWSRVDAGKTPGDVVSAGDSVALDTTGPEFVVELVWVDEDGTYITLWRERGPEA